MFIVSVYRPEADASIQSGASHQEFPFEGTEVVALVDTLAAAEAIVNPDLHPGWLVSIEELHTNFEEAHA